MLKEFDYTDIINPVKDCVDLLSSYKSITDIHIMNSLFSYSNHVSPFDGNPTVMVLQ